MNEHSRKLSDMDPNMIIRQQHDEIIGAQRVVVINDPNNKSIQVIEIPVIVKELQIEKIEVKYTPGYIWLILGSLVTLVIVLGIKVLKG